MIAERTVSSTPALRRMLLLRLLSWWTLLLTPTIVVAGDPLTSTFSSSSSSSNGGDNEAAAAATTLHNHNNNNNNKQTQKLVDHGKELMDWMQREEGAFFHPNLIIRRTPPNDTTSPYFGMFAIGEIAENELMIEIPRSMVFHPDPPQVGDRVTVYDEDEDDEDTSAGEVLAVHSDGTLDIRFDHLGAVERNVDPDTVSHEDYPSCCATVHKLIREMKLADQSRYAPYVNYLLTQPSGQLPTSWSLSGRTLLLAALGQDDDDEDDDQLLPPFGLFGWIEEDWHARCKGGKDPLSESAYMLLAQRGWDEVMIPGTVRSYSNWFAHVWVHGGV